VHVREKKLD